MAKDLNQSRIRNSRLIVGLVLLLVPFTDGLFTSGRPGHDLFQAIGYLLTAFCAMGRLYTSAFIGGHKNQQLVTYGPFSVLRNPLYFFSYAGFLGVAALSGHLSLILLVAVVFAVMYKNLIEREEGFLKQTFGQSYLDYMDRVPRFVPNLKNYACPEEIPLVPHYLNKAFKDAVWWFAPLPLFSLIGFLQETGYLKTIFFLP